MIPRPAATPFITDSTVTSVTREKHERGHAAVLHGTFFLSRTATLIGSIFELAELHGQNHFSVLK